MRDATASPMTPTINEDQVESKDSDDEMRRYSIFCDARTKSEETENPIDIIFIVEHSGTIPKTAFVSWSRAA